MPSVGHTARSATPLFSSPCLAHPALLRHAYRRLACSRGNVPTRHATVVALANRRKAAGQKGFGPKPTPKAKREPEAGGAGVGPSVGNAEEFVPRGPTMRQQYIDRGIIEGEQGPDAGVLPQVVADRMIQRIAVFAGVPLGTLFIFFGAYFAAKYKYDITVIPAVVAYTTLGCIGASGIGITYGIMSSSWDEEEGTKLGWKEFTMNIVRAKDGLSSMLAKERREDEAASQDLDDVNEWRKEQARRKG